MPSLVVIESTEETDVSVVGGLVRAVGRFDASVPDVGH
jgi:hypothetical protein